MQKIRSGRTILRIRRGDHIKYPSKNGGVPISYLFDNFLSQTKLIVPNLIVSKAPAIVRRARVGSLQETDNSFLYWIQEIGNECPISDLRNRQ